jgi:histidyl-tRNA synthetase
MTPTLARMVGARAQALRKPIRWFSIPQLFRYERQQRGRLREHFQLNMDLIGEAGPLADAELIAAALDVLRAFGFGPREVQARVSDRRVLRALLVGRGVPEAELSLAFEVIDKCEREDHGVLAEQLARAGVTKRATDAVFEIAGLKGMFAISQALGSVPDGDEVGAPLRRAHEALGCMGLAEFVQVDLTIVRGLAYYSGIVFELFDAARALRAICGGGRYDHLIKQVAGIDLPCVGFGMGDVVVGELLRDRALERVGAPRLDVFLVGVTGDDERLVLELAHALRDRDVAVEYALRPASVRKQLELAGARGALRAVILGPDERRSGTAVVRDLQAGTEAQVLLTDVREGRFH